MKKTFWVGVAIIVSLCWGAASYGNSACQDSEWPQQVQFIARIDQVTLTSSFYCLVSLGHFRFIRQHYGCPFLESLDGVDKINSNAELVNLRLNPIVTDVYYFPQNMAECLVGNEVSGVLRSDGVDYTEIDE